jgi:hypothetical protein
LNFHQSIIFIKKRAHDRVRQNSRLGDVIKQNLHNYLKWKMIKGIFFYGGRAGGYIEYAGSKSNGSHGLSRFIIATHTLGIMRNLAPILENLMSNTVERVYGLGRDPAPALNNPMPNIMEIIYKHMLEAPRILELEYIEGQSVKPHIISPSSSELMLHRMDISRQFYRELSSQYFKLMKSVLHYTLKSPQQFNTNWILDWIHKVHKNRLFDFRAGGTQQHLIVTLPDKKGPALLETWRLEISGLI